MKSSAKTPPPRRSKELVQLLKNAKLSEHGRPFLESLLTVRHPWWNRAVSAEFGYAKVRSDEDVLVVITNLPVHWFGFHCYREHQEALAKERGVNANGLSVPHALVLESLLRAVLEDRIRLLTLPKRAFSTVRLESLNQHWKRQLFDRKEFDPLSAWLGGFHYPMWLKKQKWTRNDFAALALGINPTKFNEDEIDISTPYSILGNRVAILLRKIDEAVGHQELKFPLPPAKLIRWAQDSGLGLPKRLLSYKRAGEETHRVSSS